MERTITKEDYESKFDGMISAVTPVFEPKLVECMIECRDLGYDATGNFDPEKYQQAVTSCFNSKVGRVVPFLAGVIVGMAIHAYIVSR